MNDLELLEAYARSRSEAAFGELVQRHLGWVCSVALRQVGNRALAEEVAQSVFSLLACKAGSLRSGTILSGWLFSTTRFVASRALRAENRRKNREQIAASMIGSSTTPPEPDPDLWEQLAPHLDRAVAALSEVDRTAILLRFYEKKPLLEVGRQLGLSEEAAKKRVSRAIDKLRGYLGRRGVAVGGAALVVLLAEQAAQAAPAVLLTTVSQTATVGVAGSATLPQLAQDALAVWRWAKIKMAVSVTLSAMLMVLIVNHAYRTHSSKVLGSNANSGSQQTGINTAAGTIGATGALANSNTLAPASHFLLRVIAVGTTNGLAAARVPVNYVVDGEWTSRDDLLTDKEGFCAVPLPKGKVGRIDVGAVKDGFAQKFFTWMNDYEEPLPAGHVLALERAVTIGGVVQDSAGQPIRDVDIALDYAVSDTTFDERPTERLGFVRALTVARTDEKGVWHCALTQPGLSHLRIVTMHPNFAERSYTAIAGTSGAPDSEWFKMESLQATQAVMVLNPGFELKGFVFDTNGKPLAGAKVSPISGQHYEPTGVRAGADGSFQMSRLPAGRAQISAWAPGFAPSLKEVQIGSPSSEISFQLNHGTPFPLRIVDFEGVGIPGACAVLDLPIPHNGEFRVTTDADGRAVFQGIPSNAVGGLVFHALANGYFPARNVTLRSSDSIPTIQLLKALRVSGTVVDADTGEPVRDFKAIPTLDEGSYQRRYTCRGKLGAYSVRFTEFQPPFRVRIEAVGYEPAMSPPMGRNSPEEEHNFVLKKKSASRIIDGFVLLPGGRPAPNVSVALLTFEQGATLYNGRLNHRKESIVTTTDQQGAFKFDMDPQAHTLVAADPVNGFGLRRMYRSKPEFPPSTISGGPGTGSPFIIQLEPWGSIEGQLILSGSPVPNRRISVSRGPLCYHSVTDGLAFGFDHKVTDSEGRFSCDLVPQGEFTVSVLEKVQHTSPGMLAGIGYHSTRVISAEVHAGETTHVKIGGQGRRLTGKLIMSDGTKLDWSSRVSTASMATNPEKPTVNPPPASDDFDARLRMLEFFDESPEWRAYDRGLSLMSLQVAADGSFTVDDVMPGRYRLDVVITCDPTKPVGPSGIFEGSLREFVQVPGDENETTPFNLGTFCVKAQSAKSE